MPAAQLERVVKTCRVLPHHPSRYPESWKDDVGVKCNAFGGFRPAQGREENMFSPSWVGRAGRRRDADPQEHIAPSGISTREYSKSGLVIG